MKIIYKENNGNIIILMLSLRCLKTHSIEAIALKDVPEGIPFWIVDDDVILSDRTFRDAWDIPDTIGTPSGVGSVYSSFKDIPEKHIKKMKRVKTDKPAITVNSAKAKDITKRMVREWREQEFKKNDVNLQNALVDGVDVTPFRMKRNWLRDLPDECEGRTVDELRALLVELGILETPIS